MTNESSSITMKSDNESKLVNTTNNNIMYYNCNTNSSSNKSATATTTSSSSTTVATANTSSNLPLITLAPFSKIKRETDSSDYYRPSSSSMVAKSISATTTITSNCNSQVPTAVNSSSVSAKMGSRRIFTPQFKLQVLESYRNDSDCKGNQRATARKYNIHRRQIQKWLQCESNLRSSVANISANNVKHQFHNITHQMPIVTTSTLPSSASSSSASSSIHTNNNHHTHHHNQQYKAINNRLSLDTTRHSVALTSIPIPTSKAAQQGVLAASANVGDVGAVAPLSSSSPAFTSTMKCGNAPTSPIHHPHILTKSPAATGGPGAPLPLHPQYHRDSMGIHTPPAMLTSVPVSVPIITPHPHTHLHLANLKSHYHHLHVHMEQQQQHHHHHHHLHHPYNQVAQPTSSERRPFVPSASLPALPTSSSSSSSHSSSSTASSPPAPMTAVALSCTDTLATTPAAALSLAQAEENRIGELRDYQTTTTTSSTTTATAENRYMNENEYRTHRAAYEGFHYYMPLHMHPAATMIAPIDLSLGTKRLDYSLSYREHSTENHSTFAETTLTPSSPKHEYDDEDENEDSQLNVVDSDISESSVVDLTLRKRKVLMQSADDDVSAEKQTKLSTDEHDEKDIKPNEPAKTFKLFKPYLLGDSDCDKDSDNKISTQKDPIIWSHHTACLSPPISHESRQCSSRGSNFQSPPAPEAYPFPAGSPTFQPTNAAATPASFRCPKGSPVSGYESSSSIYSDSASSSGGDHHHHHHYSNLPHTTYSFDLKVHNINGGDHLAAKHLISDASGCIPHPPTSINHVQRWLDQESGIRQSIALYV